MIRDIIHNVLTAKRTPGTIPEKLATFGTLTRLSRKKSLPFDPQATASEYFGQFKIYGFSYLTLDFLFREVFISGEYSFTSSTPTPVIIDCGASIGDSTLYFKQLFPAARILAFEPNPHAFALLEKNLKVNHLGNVETHNTALSNTKKPISFYIESDLGTLIGSVRKDRGGKHKLTVKTEKLSDYLKKLPVIDLVKIDVEGAEVNIIQDLMETGMLSKPQQYIIEYHHNIGDDPSHLAQFLQAFEVSGFNYNIKATYLRENRFQDIMLYFTKR